MSEKIKHIHCPVNGTDCTNYTNFSHPCRCLAPDPYKICDAFRVFWDKEDDYVDDDWSKKEQEETINNFIKDLRKEDFNFTDEEMED